MIELDEIQEPQKNNYTPIAILAVIALLLVVVGFIGYKDYVDSKAEKIVSESKYEKDQELENLKAEVQQLKEMQTANNSTFNRINKEIEEAKAQIASNNNDINHSAVPTTTEEEDLFGPPPSQLLASSSMPANNSFPRDLAPSPLEGYSDQPLLRPPPSLDNRSRGTVSRVNNGIRTEMSEDELFGAPPSLRNDRGSTTQSNGISSPVDAKTGMTENELFGAPPPVFDGELQSLNEALRNATPAKQLSPQELKIRNSPSIAKVIDYNGGYVTIDGGKSNNIQSGGTFQISRDAQVIGRINIEKVFETESVGSFLNAGGGLTPQYGDKIISSF